MGAVIAEERGKNHGVLADPLTEAATSSRGNGRQSPQANLTFPSPAHDLFVEMTPRRSFEDSILPENVVAACHELVEEQHRHDLLDPVISSHGIEFCSPVSQATGRLFLAEALATPSWSL